jgi:hypothetical protein
MKCMTALSRNPANSVPPECVSNYDKHYVHEGSMHNRSSSYQAYLDNYVCGAANRWFDAHDPNRTGQATIRYQIHVKAHGNKGCGGGSRKSINHLLSTRVARCQRERRPKTYLSLPGKRFFTMTAYYGPQVKSFKVSYKSLKSSHTTAQSCYEACYRDDRCLAWVYHKAPSQQYSTKYTAGQCELIDHYPRYEPSSTTDAGMK